MRPTRRTATVGIAAAGLIASLTPLALAAPDEPAHPARPAAPAPNPPVSWTGEIGSGLGSTTASAPGGSCDVNGDKHQDIVTGAWFWNRAPYRGTGAAYVLLGSDQPQGGNLANPAASSAVRINGPARTNAMAGFSVACLGDTNGDRLADLAISDLSSQRVFVVYGARNFTSLNLDAMGSRGYVIQAPKDAGNFGYQVVGLGDLDRDRRGEIGITAVAANDGERKRTGRAWVVKGAPGTTTVDVTSSERVLGTITGGRGGDALSALAPAGDVNGDRVPDLVTGSYTASSKDGAGRANGAAHVIFGRRDGRLGHVNTGSLGHGGFTIEGPARQRDRLGISVAGAGDINGDGLADLVIGADGISDATTGPRSGGAAIVHGARSNDTVRVNPTAGQPVTGSDGAPRGWWIEGAAEGDGTGFSVAGVGDVNGDRIPDVAVGAFGADATDAAGETLSTAGKAYIVHGQRTAHRMELAGLTPSQGRTIMGTAKGQRLGRSVAAVGDVDRNGRADVAVGGESAGSGGDRSGTVALLPTGRAKSSGSTTGRPASPRTKTLRPNPVAASIPLSEAQGERNWKPTAADTCSADLHAQYSMVANDGKRYPTWHPAQVRDPRTGRMCSFGHEHGSDPRTSDIYPMVSAFLSDTSAKAPGIPFGMVSEASSAHHEGMDMRHEDNAGHKVIVANDVALLNQDDRSPVTLRKGRRQVRVTCDYLIKMHQGSHSADATKNNAHELVYGVSCTDGTQAVISTLSRLGRSNEYTRGCDPSVTVPTSGSHLPPGDAGRRLIPDASCVDEHVLVPKGRASDVWGLYELWETANKLTTSKGTALASYDPWLAVRNPSRVADATSATGASATLAAKWALDAKDQGTAKGWPWDGIPASPEQAQTWTGSPFNGAQRDFYLAGTSLGNTGGNRVWYSDPYGRDATTRPFHGSVRQLLVKSAKAVDQSQVERVNMGLEDDFGAPGTGVHAPN